MDQKLTPGQVVVSFFYFFSQAWRVDRIIHGTIVYYYLHLRMIFLRVNVGKYTIHGSYGYRTASKLLLWFLCHVYREPLNNPFTMTFSPLTLCRTIVVSPAKKFNEWWKRRCRHCQLRVEKDISAYGTGDEIYVPWIHMTPVEWLELIGPFFWRGCFAPKTQDTHRFRIIFIIYVSYLYYSIPNMSFQGTLQGLVLFYTYIRILDDLICFQHVSMSKKHHPF